MLVKGEITLKEYTPDFTGIEWKINDFCNIRFTSIRSKLFKLFKSMWYLEIMKQVSSSEEYLCMAIRSTSHLDQVYADYRMGIVRDGITELSEMFPRVLLSKYFEHKRLISMNTLRRSEGFLLPGKTLSLFCSVCYLDEIPLTSLLAPTDTRIKFNPPTGTDTMMKGGLLIDFSTHHHCITATTEYENKSLEALRKEDYTANRKASVAAAGGTAFGATTQQTDPFGSTLDVSTSAFSSVTNTQSKPLFGTTTTPTDTRIKFNPPTGTGTMMKGGFDFSTHHQCITATREYENKSLEALRKEDYTANRKASVAAARGTAFGATTQQTDPFGSTLAVSTSAFSSVTNTQSKPLFGTTTNFGSFKGSSTESSFSSRKNGRPNRPISTISQTPKILYQTKSTSTSEDNSECLWLSKGYTTLSENFKCLYSSQRRTDVMIKVQNKEFHAHKLILSTRSDVFAAMFEHDSSEEKSGVVDIPDCDPQSFEDFLFYLYTGKLDIVSSSNAVGLFKTADKYHLEELQEECIRCMIREIDVDSFCDIFHVAVMYNKSDLLSAVITFFMSNASSILSTTEWLTLLEENAEICNELLVKFAKSGQQK